MACVFFAGCGRATSPSTTGSSGVKFRAFVSQDVSSSSVSAGLDIVDATLDKLLRAPGVSAGGAPGLMAVSNNKLLTLVFDASSNSINAVNNKQETSAGNVVLPSWTESIAIPNDATAYYLNCGPECGGTFGSAGVTVLSLTNNPSLTASGSVVFSGGAADGVLLGTTLYVAGTVPGAPCPATTAAPFCGTLTVINVSNPSAPEVMNTATITDGYHNRMAITADNQVFVGARNCSNVNTSTEQRGCLSIYNAATNSFVIGTDRGDVTGIQPVTGRPEVYVVENGELRIWDTIKDALILPQNQIDLVGHAVDVKIVD